MMNDKLFTQELIELVNSSSCSLIGDKKSGCAYRPDELCKEKGLDKECKSKAMPKKLSISFKIENDFVKITSVSLRTIGCGTISMNTKKYRSFRGACRSVIERCCITSKGLYGNIKRVVVVFGEGEPNYKIAKGILKVENIPVISGYSALFDKSEKGIMSQLSQVVNSIEENIGSRATIVGYGVSKLVRRDYYDCYSLYKDCKDSGKPSRKVSILFNVFRKDLQFNCYLDQGGSIIGIKEGVIFKIALNLFKSVEISS